MDPTAPNEATTPPSARVEGAGDDETLERIRRVTSEALMEHFASEHIPLEEFERRIEALHEATSASELRALLADLPGRGGPAGPTRGEG